MRPFLCRASVHKHLRASLSVCKHSRWELEGSRSTCRLPSLLPNMNRALQMFSLWSHLHQHRFTSWSLWSSFTLCDGNVSKWWSSTMTAQTKPSIGSTELLWLMIWLAKKAILTREKAEWGNLQEEKKDAEKTTRRKEKKAWWAHRLIFAEIEIDGEENCNKTLWLFRTKNKAERRCALSEGWIRGNKCERLSSPQFEFRVFSLHSQSPCVVVAVGL